MDFCKGLQDDIASVDKTLALVLLILNIFLPGLGTIINSAMGPSCSIKQLVIGLV